MCWRKVNNTPGEIMNTYTIRLKRRFCWDKKLKKVKVNLFPEDMNPAINHFFTEENGKTVPRMQRQNAVKFMLVILEDESIQVVNLDKYQGYEISKDLFFIKAKQAEQESQGKAKLV
jgi:hypothetical protein